MNKKSKECKVEYVDNVEVDFQVKAMIFRESLKVTDKVNGKTEQTRVLDRMNQIEDIMRKRNEDAWYK